MGLPLASREAVLDALDVAETARAAAQVDRLIDAASRSVEALTRRTFHPVRATRYFSWPNDQMGTSWRLWLDANELISVTSIVSGGIPVTEYFLEPQPTGPPYNRVEIDLGASSSWSVASTNQRAIAIDGVWGYGNDTRPATTLASSTTGGAVTITVDDGAGIGVGDLLLIDTEYLLVTARSWATTSQTQQADLAAAKADVALTVTDGTAFGAGEKLLLGSERMVIADIIGNTLMVERAQDGTVLAAHSGHTVYAGRALTVTRARCGTTAASHTGGAAVAVHDVPALVRQLVVAEAMRGLQHEGGAYGAAAAYAKAVDSASGKGSVSDPISDLRAQVVARYGRQARTRAV